eukprot:1049875-Alexandrium_andersonii.AAC.1
MSASLVGSEMCIRDRRFVVAWKCADSPPPALHLASLHCNVPAMQSASRQRPVSPTIRLNPQSAMRKLQHRIGRSNLERRGPRCDSKLALGAAEACALRCFFEQIRGSPPGEASRAGGAIRGGP